MKILYKKSCLLFLLFFLLLFLRFPDIRNEMKYLVIAQEMLEYKNIWILSYLGNLYPDKPPLYFWLLSSLQAIFGKQWAYPLSLLLGSFLPMLGIVFLCFQQMKHWNPNLKGRFLYYVVTTPYFMAVGIFLRMDMLMTFFITLSLSTFLYLYRRPEKISYPYLFVFYLSIFLGVFSKGALGFLFPLIILFVFLYLEKNLRFALKIKIVYGFVLILLFVVSWFSVLYFQPQGDTYILSMLGDQTLGRALQSSSHARPLYYYFAHLFLSFFPFGFLYFAGIFYYLSQWKYRERWSSFEKWAFAWAVPGVFLLSLFSGKLDIYMLPLFPGAFFLALILENKWSFRGYSIGKLIQKLQNLVSCFSFSFLILLPIYNRYYTVKPLLPYMKKNSVVELSYFESPDLQNISYFLPELHFVKYPGNPSPQKKKYILLKQKYISKLSTPYEKKFQTKNYLFVEGR